MRRQNRPRPLRRRLMVPLGAAFAALWLGTMALFTGAAVGETERTVDLQYEAAAYWLDLHGQGYQASLTDGIGTEAEAASAYRQILSGETYRLQTIGDGGMAAALRDGDGGVLRSQAALTALLAQAARRVRSHPRDGRGGRGGGWPSVNDGSTGAGRHRRGACRRWCAGRLR